MIFADGNAPIKMFVIEKRTITCTFQRKNYHSICEQIPQQPPIIMPILYIYLNYKEIKCFELWIPKTCEMLKLICTTNHNSSEPF